MTDTLKLRVVALHRAEPSLDTTAVAHRLAMAPKYVRKISIACGLAIPHAKNGRPKGTTGRKWYARSRSRAACQNP